MLPNTLTISAFGPYKNLTQIDFEVFKQDGLFLITGPTGSGKTMIFDALTFALYGVSSGSERSSEQFRSDSASNDVMTFVELDFTLHNEHYLIKRTPKYFLEGRKTPKMPTALLTLPDGKIIDGVKEVNVKIKEILGIDENQFKQIVMIAQGEFTKLIYAGSDEREKVLRNLFKTDNLVYLEEQLKEKVKEYRSNYDLLFSQRKLLEESLKLDNLDIDLHKYLIDFKTELKNSELLYQKQLNDYDKAKQQLNITSLNNQRLVHLEELQIKLDSYLNDEKYYQELDNEIKLLKMAVDLQPDYLAVNQSQIKVEQLGQTLNDTNELLKKSKEAFVDKEKEYLDLTKVHEKKKQIMILLQKNKELKQTIIEYQQALKKQNEIIKKIRIIKSKLVGLEDKQQKLQKLIDSDSNSIAKLDKLKSDYEIINQQYQKLHHYKLEVHQLSSDYDKLLLAEDKGYDLKDEYQKVAELYLKEKQNYDLIEHRFRLNQAGILASGLKDNQPCPVCGSLVHPCLADFDKEIIHQEDLERAKRNFDKCQEHQNDLYNALILKQQEITLLKKQLELDSKRLDIKEELDKEVFIKVLGTVYIEENSLLQQAKALENEIIYLNKLKNTLDNHCQDLNQAEKEIGDQQQQLNLYNDQLNQLVGKMNSLNYLKELTVPKIDQMIIDEEKQISELDCLVNKIETAYHDLKEKMIQLETNVSLLNQQLQEEKSNYHSKLKIYLDKLKKLFVNEKSFIELLSKTKLLQRKEKEYNDYLIAKVTLQNQIKQLNDELKDIKYKDITKMKDETDYLKATVDDLQLQLNKQKAKLITITNTIENIDKIDQQLSDNYEVYQLYLDLSEIASGKNEYRISFERYVLAAYFENILAYANILLRRMAQGRYQLYRRDSRSKGAGKQGLELDVLDLESGMFRDVKTLSGGESFKAALSLALGLSKMIQSFAGGIELNTLFIDEGFGSLDNQSLDQAIDCLMDLQQDGKLIGIISHVSELKERIDHKIVLSRENKETYISIE